MESSNLRAHLIAFFVTFLWATSWVLIKWGLSDITPILFAGLRYFLAGLILLGTVVNSPQHRRELASLDRRWVLKLMAYGLVFYTLTQGAQFVSLFYLPAITVSFGLNLTTIVVLLLSIPLLGEVPNRFQVMLIGIGLVGVILFFFPIDLPLSEVIGLAVLAVGVLANALSLLLGRSINRSGEVSPLVITTVSMVMGGTMLLASALVIEGAPQLTPRVVVYIIWLAAVNTSLAFFLWNHALKHIQAVNASIINSTMLPQITILAIVFFGEWLDPRQWVALVMIFLTAVLVPLSRPRPVEQRHSSSS